MSSSDGNNIMTVEIQKRMKSNKNTTHDCIIDMNIKTASLWKVDKRKHLCALILYTLTLGTLYLVTFLYKPFYIFMSCIPSNIEEAEYVVITDINGNKSVELIIKEEFSISRDEIEDNESLDESLTQAENRMKQENEKIMEEIKKTPYYERKEKITVEEAQRRLALKQKIQGEKPLTYQKTFLHLANKYRYDQNEGMFVPATIYLNRYTRRELINLKDGIPSKHIYDYLAYTYPKNEIKLKNQSMMKIFIGESIKPSYIYNLFCIVIWCIQWWYWHFAIVIAFLTLYLIITSTRRKMENLKKIINADHNTKLVKVRRPFNNINKFSEYELVEANTIVPGDSILLEREENSNDPIIVPCDGIILEGYCTVNESDLTGENTLVLRKEILDEDEMFNYSRDHDSVLFQGTSISTLFSPKAKKEQIILLATNTGYNTYRGNMVKNWEHQKPENERFNFDLIILGIVFFVMWVLSSVLVFLFYTEDYDNDSKSVINISYSERFHTCLDNITVIFPPSLAICVHFGRLYFNYKLKEKNISCVIEKKIDTAGRIDVVVLDKTGTLTESKLGIHCYKTTQLDQNEQLVLGEEELFPSTLNKIYKKIWQHLYKEKLKCEIENKPIDYSYQYLSKFNIIYFTECLATCHNIYRINNQNFGNSLDQKLFNEINWDIIQENDDINSSMYVQPHNAYKITENTIFGTNRNKRIEVNFCLHYLERFEFMSQFQSMTVVVRNSIDNSIRVYTKGAPEKLKKICLPETLPIDLDQQLKKYTGDGFRVLACASRKIEKFNKNTTTVEQLEQNMTFLGLIVFQNQIKKDTKIHIEHLADSKCKLVIATGDNVFTTVSVALQCGILQFDNDIYHIETSDNNDSSLMITHSYYQEVNNEESSKKERKSILQKKSKNSIINKKFLEECNDIIHENENTIMFQKQIETILLDEQTVVCCSGSALSLILKKGREKKSNYTSLLEKLILVKGKIFYRMLPDNKSSLVSFFQRDKHTIVAMCGDGANDCSAFMTSDVGVAIRQTTGNNLISHFYSKNESIGCLEDIITNGRACLENKIIIIKYMILYAFIQICCVLFLNIEKMKMNNPQYVFMDVFCVLVPMLIAARTMAKVKLSDTKPSESMFDPQFSLSTIGQIAIQLGNEIGFGLYIRKNTLTPEYDIKQRDGLTILSTYCYIFSLFQYLNVLFIFNSTSVHRKPFYSNRTYLFYYALLFFLCTLFITIKEMPKMMFGLSLILFEDDTENFEFRLEKNKAIAILWILGLFIASFIYEGIIFLLCGKRVKKQDVSIIEEVKEKENQSMNDSL